MTIGILDEQRTDIFPVHLVRRLANTLVNSPENRFFRINARYRLVEENQSFFLGLQGFGDNCGIGPLQHPFAEGIRKILSEILIHIAQFEKYFLWNQVKHGIFRDPQGSHGNTVIQKHGNTTIDIPLTQHTQHGLSAAIFKISFSRPPLHNIEMPYS